MVSAALFVWLGTKCDMPPLYYVLCGVYFVFAMIRAAINAK